jgi:hypothetical protein
MTSVQPDDLIAELRELSRDVTGGHDMRRRRLAVLRRLEGALQDGERSRSLAIA